MTIRVHIHGVRSYTFIMCTTYICVPRSCTKCTTTKF